uniref:Uncharacterized protein n=1 Tax=Chromera velia CCMP2878 TaxID=1169474 RepID=A0A0G4G473_9ALVE|eukprot:Cvel_20117.t1-p1 / transcript=Cvel_20117.t1 / gene=Cvel_20117 / organism=Chromera_velia_CCMP2878 / gene_product=hypothetical protein / transcript_product=hypothetical protein / location=Cvel_scaffold1783:20364-28416(+) / protein_length=590 / sequence_SO=supercontig / SO=protein_coding / is_pseudo=false
MRDAHYLPTKVRQYIEEHQLNERVNVVLNEVLKALPPDPWGAIGGKLYAHSDEIPEFEGLECVFEDEDTLTVNVVLNVRAARVVVHSLKLPRSDVRRAEAQSGEGGGETTPDDISKGELSQEAALINGVRSVVKQAGLESPDNLSRLICDALFWAASNGLAKNGLETALDAALAASASCLPSLTTKETLVFSFGLSRSAADKLVELPFVPSLSAVPVREQKEKTEGGEQNANAGLPPPPIPPREGGSFWPLLLADVMNFEAPSPLGNASLGLCVSAPTEVFWVTPTVDRPSSKEVKGGKKDDKAAAAAQPPPAEGEDPPKPPPPPPPLCTALFSSGRKLIAAAKEQVTAVLTADKKAGFPGMKVWLRAGVSSMQRTEAGAFAWDGAGTGKSEEELVEAIAEAIEAIPPHLRGGVLDVDVEGGAGDGFLVKALKEKFPDLSLVLKAPAPPKEGEEERPLLRPKDEALGVWVGGDCAASLARQSATLKGAGLRVVIDVSSTLSPQFPCTAMIPVGRSFVLAGRDKDSPGLLYVGSAVPSEDLCTAVDREIVRTVKSARQKSETSENQAQGPSAVETRGGGTPAVEVAPELQN